eukprot:TRINITY_DN32848_c0_g1_i1.p1 TRINITY_DN32848_c0_g1~~TRINITY_DN32848_c0_g1_i1.p1  ORF type:complete len:487 (+),score=118.26 TRINITY_DN32848_c0_g1_i1:46-1461(+)
MIAGGLEPPWGGDGPPAPVPRRQVVSPSLSQERSGTLQPDDVGLEGTLGSLMPKPVPNGAAYLEPAFHGPGRGWQATPPLRAPIPSPPRFHPPLPVVRRPPPDAIPTDTSVWRGPPPKPVTLAGAVVGPDAQRRLTPLRMYDERRRYPPGSHSLPERAVQRQWAGVLQQYEAAPQLSPCQRHLSPPRTSGDSPVARVGAGQFLSPQRATRPALLPSQQRRCSPPRPPQQSQPEPPPEPPPQPPPEPPPQPQWGPPAARVHRRTSPPRPPPAPPPPEPPDRTAAAVAAYRVKSLEVAQARVAAELAAARAEQLAVEADLLMVEPPRVRQPPAHTAATPPPDLDSRARSRALQCRTRSPPKSFESEADTDAPPLMDPTGGVPERVCIQRREVLPPSVPWEANIEWKGDVLRVSAWGGAHTKRTTPSRRTPSPPSPPIPSPPPSPNIAVPMWWSAGVAPPPAAAPPQLTVSPPD